MDPWIGSILAIVNIAAIKVTAQINISEHLLSLLLETYSKEECIVIEWFYIPTSNVWTFFARDGKTTFAILFFVS